MAAPLALHADEFTNLKIQMDQNVLYCSARINVDSDTFSLAMKDGIMMATQWHIQVGKVREYWLNKTIADITVIRRATPDLLTRSWLLSDASSGISRRVYRIEEAIQFLSLLEKRPVLDRSLLLSDSPYRISVSVAIHTGDINDAWWANLWQSTSASMKKDFSLP